MPRGPPRVNRPSRPRSCPPAEVQALPLVPAQRRDVPPGLSSAAISAASIWNKYGGMIEPLAAKIGIDPAAAVAVVSVESGGRGVGPDGRMIIRFENHVFWSLWGKANPDAYNALFAFNPPPGKSFQGHKYRANPNAPWQDVHAGQASEWDAFTIASSLNANAARQSISMGLAQIMGFNFKTVGYDSVEAMFDAYAADERWQLLGLFSYIVSRGLVARFAAGRLRRLCPRVQRQGSGAVLRGIDPAAPRRLLELAGAQGIHAGAVAGLAGVGCCAGRGAEVRVEVDPQGKARAEEVMLEVIRRRQAETLRRVAIERQAAQAVLSEVPPIRMTLLFSARDRGRPSRSFANSEINSSASACFRRFHGA